MVIASDFDWLHHGSPLLAISNQSSKSCFHFAQSPGAVGTGGVVVGLLSSVESTYSFCSGVV